MSINIRTINLVKKAVISDRDVVLGGKHVQSVNIYQTDGSFITTEPFNNRVLWYPQAPYNVGNTALGGWKIFESFAKYGYLNYPLDARFDYARRTLWIADSGNKKVAKVNIDSETVIKTIDNDYFSNSLAVNINNGNVYVKSIKDKSNGIVQQYGQDGTLLNTFEFPCEYGIDFEDIKNEYSFIMKVPLPSSMVLNHSSNRLWWTGDNFVYMVDVLNKNIIPFKIDGYRNARGVDVDFASGNAFVIAQSVYNTNWYILQMSKDNNQILSTAYIDKVEPSNPPYGA